VAARPADGRSTALRPAVGGRPAVSRTGAPPGPLVARRELGTPRSYGTPDPGPRREPHGRIRRFVHRYGWRAYAVPLLAVATLVTLGDLAANGADSSTTPVARISAAPTTAAPGETTAAPGATDAPVAPAEGEGVPDAAVGASISAPAPAAAEAYVEKGAGSVSVVDVNSPVYGSGPLRRFVVETEDGIGVDDAAFAKAVRTTLGDPRSWGNGGRMSFQEVGAAAAAASQYDFKVTLVSPGNMEKYCPGVGTGGYTSCRYGERAVINLARWATAVPYYEGDLATYRQYVVNHEVGHALGNHHQSCPAPGAAAPVMQQQTLGLQGCVRNAWPYP
jgi:hypothetical protein